MTATEFENKWTNGINGILAGDPRRFEVARVAHAVQNRMAEGLGAEAAKNRVLEEPYYREALTVAVDPLNDDTNVLDDFRAIDGP